MHEQAKKNHVIWLLLKVNNLLDVDYNRNNRKRRIVLSTANLGMSGTSHPSKNVP